MLKFVDNTGHTDVRVRLSYDYLAAAQQNPALKVTDSKAISVSVTKTHRPTHTEHTTLTCLVSVFLLLQ